MSTSAIQDQFSRRFLGQRRTVVSVEASTLFLERDRPAGGWAHDLKERQSQAVLVARVREAFEAAELIRSTDADRELRLAVARALKEALEDAGWRGTPPRLWRPAWTAWARLFGPTC